MSEILPAYLPQLSLPPLPPVECFTDPEADNHPLYRNIIRTFLTTEALLHTEDAVLPTFAVGMTDYERTQAAEYLEANDRLTVTIWHHPRELMVDEAGMVSRTVGHVSEIVTYIRDNPKIRHSLGANIFENAGRSAAAKWRGDEFANLFEAACFEEIDRRNHNLKYLSCLRPNTHFCKQKTPGLGEFLITYK